jgi:predicted N-acetyltransferase YhbS
LESASAKDIELNEANWWSHWADVRWMGQGSYVMLSSDFDEYFFNRAGFVDCGAGKGEIARMEAEFETAGRPPCFSIQNECKELVAVLNSRGYTAFDEMSVMQLSQLGLERANDLKVLRGEDLDTTTWAVTYSLAFYGDHSQQAPVARIIDRLAREPSVTLLAGEKDKEMVGVLAAFRTPGLLGVYCVGTLESSRGMGVAGSLIHEANKVASAEARVLVLQTIVSDGAEGFYARGGFRRLYMKHLMQRKASNSNQSERAVLA